jgi:putative intracellular protease/amidase
MQLFLREEVQVMMDLLEAAGYEVVVATPSGESIEAGTLRLKSDLKVADVKLKRYVAVVLPCMGASDYDVPQELVDLLKEANARRMIIAAQHSVEVLLPAGLITGRKVSMSPGAIIDRNLVTSYNCPYTARGKSQPIDTPQLIRLTVELLARK